MQDLTKYYTKYKIFVWPIAVAVIGLVVVTSVIMPQFTSYLKIKDEIANLDNQSIKYEDKAAGLEDIDTVATKEGLKVALTVLPTDQDVPEAMASLQDIVDQSGLILQGISYNSARGGKDNFQFNTTIVGPMSSLKEFFIKMNESSRVFRVDSISARFQRNSIITEAEVPLSVFYSPSVEIALGSFDQPAPKLTKKEEELLSQLSNSMPKATSSALEDTSSIPLGKINPFE